MIATTEPLTEHYDTLASILGKKYIKSKMESPYDFIQIALKGLNANAINNFRSYFDIPLDTAAAMLNTSGPTLYRWLKAKRNLETRFSVKLIEVASLFLYGSNVFGSKENFFKWMHLPNMGLGGMQPQDLIVFPEGISKIRDVLGRIEHGVYG